MHCQRIVGGVVEPRLIRKVLERVWAASRNGSGMVVVMGTLIGSLSPKGDGQVDLVQYVCLRDGCQVNEMHKRSPNRT
jgi:hypothetical protein